MPKVGENIYVSMTKDGLFALSSLLRKNKKIDEVITLPKKLSSNISDYANFSEITSKYNVKLTYTNDINGVIKRFLKETPNLIIVNGWSQLLSKELLDLPKNGCVGTHPALLPKNRGRAPIAWHFINNEKYGGISVFYLEPSADSGPVIDQERFIIGKSDNATFYYKKITELGAKLLVKNFDPIESGSARRTAKMQNDKKATYLLKRRPKDSELDFSKSNSKQIHNLVRAVSDVYPLANFTYKKIKYFVLQSELPRYTPIYSGTPGQIAKLTDKFMWVLCKGGIVEFNVVLDENRSKVGLKNVFVVGDVLNE